MSCKSGSYRSYGSYTFDDSIKHPNFELNCYYCRAHAFKYQEEYEKHIVQKHVGKPAYSGLADIRKYGLEDRGCPCEI
jgi:hypothetical protein